MTTEVTANINSAECIKSASHWGYNTITNICNGKVSQIDWGGPDWIVYTLLMLMLFGVVIFIFAGLSFIIKDIRSSW